MLETDAVSLQNGVNSMQLSNTFAATAVVEDYNASSNLQKDLPWIQEKLSEYYQLWIFYLPTDDLHCDDK